MKIYFAGSIRGGREDAALYSKLIEHLKNWGKVFTEHIGGKLTRFGENRLNDSQIHNRDLKWLLASDVVIAEVSTPSLGIGYEIGRAVENGKKVLCLCRLDVKLSAMIAGCPNVVVKKYKTLDEAKKLIDNFLRVLV